VVVRTVQAKFRLDQRDGGTRLPAKFLHVVALLIASSLVASGQQTSGLTLPAAVARAYQHYPGMRIPTEQREAAAQAIELVLASRLPSVNLFAQWNRATRNNVLGLLLPQPFFSPISGPVLGERNDMGSAWGSLTGVLVSWEPIDFGRRKAALMAARQRVAVAEEEQEVIRLQLGAMVASAFLDLLAAEQLREASHAALRRAQGLERTLLGLVEAGLRTEAELQQVVSERVEAEVQYRRAVAAIEVARATLSQFTGLEVASLQLKAGPLVAELPPAQLPSFSPEKHPLVTRTTAEAEYHRLRQIEQRRLVLPRLDLRASVYARGTGAHPDGRLDGGLAGLGPNVSNWVAGAVLTFTPTEWNAAAHRLEAERHLERQFEAQAAKEFRDLQAALEQARARLEAARQIADRTPERVQAARKAHELARVRYETGLATIVEVIETQRLLAQAEAEDALARLAAWRALLELAVAGGDLEQFLKLLGN